MTAEIPAGSLAGAGGAGATPDGFAGSAGAGLGAAGGQIQGVQDAASQGTLTLSQQAASALLAAIGQLQNQAADLLNVADSIDKPLHFGHSWVGLTMDTRLRTVAAGQNSSVRPVLTQFATLLGQISDTIQQAAHLTAQNDQDQAQLLTRAGEQSS
ncbi:MAG TPA: hypothetical protein VHX38_28275 [Pseudonocardiaceae bacterium]|jgi:hypothetical protein|nr:hypothetical protein [Pseudonocardiaceae bacterium]